MDCSTDVKDNNRQTNKILHFDLIIHRLTNVTVHFSRLQASGGRIDPNNGIGIDRYQYNNVDTLVSLLQFYQRSDLTVLCLCKCCFQVPLLSPRRSGTPIVFWCCTVTSGARQISKRAGTVKPGPTSRDFSNIIFGSFSFGCPGPHQVPRMWDT